MRTLTTLALALALALPAAADEKSKPASPEAKSDGPVAALKVEFKVKEKELITKFQESNDPAEKAKIRTEFFAFMAESGKKALAIAEKDPKSAQAREAAVYVMTLPPVPTVAPLLQKAAVLIEQNHADSPDIKDAVQQLAGNAAPWAEPLLRKLAKQGATPDIKGLATYSLAQSLAGSDDAAKAAEAEKLYEQCAGEFGAVKVSGRRGDSTLGDMAKKPLFRMKMLGIGKPAPEIEGKDIAGKPIKLSDFRGKVVVLDIWATWCGPCRAMIPHERDMVSELKDKPFALISISGDQEKEALEKFLKKEEMPWTHLWNGDVGNITEKWSVEYFPTIYVLDQKGVIRFKDVRDKELSAAVEKLLKDGTAK